MKKTILAAAVATILLTQISAHALTLTVKGLGTSSANGKYLCLLFNSAVGFPKEPAKAYKSVTGTVAGNTGSCIFPGVPAGTYAVSTFHDKNSDEKLNTGMFGIPQEKYGFSNNASEPFGPPSFQKAAFKLTADYVLQINLK